MCYCPTPTLHLNLALTGDGAFLLSPQKTHTVWFISILNYGDTENVLINHLLLVIPVSYPCHYTNLCPHKPHKHAHTHTHTYIYIYIYIYIYALFAYFTYLHYSIGFIFIYLFPRSAVECFKVIWNMTIKHQPRKNWMWRKYTPNNSSAVSLWHLMQYLKHCLYLQLICFYR